MDSMSWRSSEVTFFRSLKFLTMNWKFLTLFLFYRDMVSALSIVLDSSFQITSSCCSSFLEALTILRMDLRSHLSLESYCGISILII